MLIAARVIFVRHQLIPPLHLCFSRKFCGIYLQLASMTAITMAGFFFNLTNNHWAFLPTKSARI